jgi:hypothetical protein
MDKALSTTGQLLQPDHHTEANVVLDKIKRGATELDIAEEHFSFWVTYRISIERYMRLRIAAPKRPYVRRNPPPVVTPTSNGKKNKCSDELSDSAEDEYIIKYKRIKT